MGVFDSIVIAANETGVFAFYLPFLITFALFYGLFKKANIFGRAAGDNQGKDTGNAINAILSFGIALYVIGFTPVGVTVAEFFGAFFSYTTILISTFVIGAVLFSVIPGLDKTDKFQKNAIKAMISITALVLIGIFISSGGLVVFGPQATGIGGFGIGGIELSSQDILIIVFGLITVGVLAWLMRGDKPEETTTPPERT